MKKERQSKKKKNGISKKILIAASCIGMAFVFWKVPNYVANKTFYYKKKYKGK